MYDDFQAMALRAGVATYADGIIFSETSRDTLDKNWEELSEETRRNWKELADLLKLMLVRPIDMAGAIQLTASQSKH